MSLPFPTTAAAAANNINSSVGVNMDPRQLADMEAPMIALAQASGGDIRKLLYGFFSFLHRRTDFYVVVPPPPPSIPEDDPSSSTLQGNSMGFKEGDAEKLLLASFRQFPLRRVPSPPAQPATPTQPPQPSAATAAAAAASPSSLKQPSKASATSSASSPQKGPTSHHGDSSDANDAAVLPAKGRGASSKASVVRYTEEGLQVPVGNGGSGPAYEWTQTIDECTVMIGPLPADCQRARDLSVELASTTLSVRPKKKGLGPSRSSGSTSGTEEDDGALVSGTLTERIVPSESTWTIEGGVLVLLLHKAIPSYWRAVLVGDEEIDTTLVDSRRHIDEYDAETQAKLRKIMFDEQQLRKGLPTSDEILGVPPPPAIPPLPTGVEYIDQSVLDQNRNARKDPPT